MFKVAMLLVRSTNTNVMVTRNIISRSLSCILTAMKRWNSVLFRWHVTLPDRDYYHCHTGHHSKINHCTKWSRYLVTLRKRIARILHKYRPLDRMIALWGHTFNDAVYSWRHKQTTNAVIFLKYSSNVVYCMCMYYHFQQLNRPQSVTNVLVFHGIKLLS